MGDICDLAQSFLCESRSIEKRRGTMVRKPTTMERRWARVLM